jgi:proteasome accessory factor B
VWVADGRATALRRAGTSVGVRQLAGRDGEVIEVEIGSSDRLARDVSGHGADAIVLEPESLREEVLARLRAQVPVAEEQRP